jgi:hypothetical protein
LGSWLQKFQSMVSWLPCFGAQGEEGYHGKKHVEQNCSLDDSQESETEKGNMRPRTKTHPSLTYFL